MLGYLRKDGSSSHVNLEQTLFEYVTVRRTTKTRKNSVSFLKLHIYDMSFFEILHTTHFNV